MIGDINVCIMKKSNRNAKYLNSLYQNTLVPLISEPTREEVLDGQVTISCLDHINLRSQRQLKSIATIIKDKIADHDLIALRITKEGNQNLKNKKTVKMIQVLDNKKVQRQLELIDWDTLKEINNPENLLNELTSKLNTIYENCTKTVKENKHINTTPWVSERVKKEIEKKQELLKKWRKNKRNISLHENYKTQRNLTNNLIKKEKRIYLFKRFQNAKGDMKKTWSLINQLMDRKINESIETNLQRNFKTEDTKQLANDFNSNFLQQILAIKEKNKGPQMDLNMIDYEPHCNSSQMFLRHATEKDVRLILSEMKTSGKGVDGIRHVDIIKNPLIFTPIITLL